MSDGQHIHGDEVHGDKVAGDKHETHIHNYGGASKPITKDDLSVVEQEILKVAYMGNIWESSTLGNSVPLIHDGGAHQFPRDLEHTRALKRLNEFRLIVRNGGGGSSKRYETTVLGDEIAKSIVGTGPTL